MKAKNLMYQLTTTGVRRLADNAFIPNSPGNGDWEAYRKWAAIVGNVAAPADFTPPELLNLSDSDKRMARIAEDLINALVKGNALKLADLPQSARDLLAQRATWRAALPPGTTTL